MPPSLSRRKTFRSADFFRNECRFYEVVLRKFAEFQKEKGFPDEFSRVASLVKLFYIVSISLHTKRSKPLGLNFVKICTNQLMVGVLDN